MKKILLFLILFCVSGCVMRSAGTSYDGLSAHYAGDAQLFAERVAQELRQRHSPAQTSLALDRAPGVFGDSLELALRNSGFALDSRGQNISYTLDVLQMEGTPSKGFVQVHLADGQLFSFSRELESGAAIPSTSPNLPVSMELAEQNPLQSVSLPDDTPDKVLKSNQPSQASLALATPQSDTVPPHTVRATATAARLAKRNNVPVADFCQWNNVSPNETLPTGFRVYLNASERPSVPTVTAPRMVASTQPAHQATSSAQPTSRVEATKASTPQIATSMPAAPQVAQHKPALVSAVAPLTAPLPSIASLPKPSVSQSVEAPTALPVEHITAAPIQETWSIRPGGLRVQLSAWASRAGYQVVWKAENDFGMESHANFEGEFLTAVQDLFAGLQRSGGYALRVTVYLGNKVLEIAEG